MNRRDFVKTIGWTAAVSCLTGCRTVGAGAPNRRKRPNIVLIMADDMGFSDIGCYGGEIRTPHLDRLAAEGLRFRRFYNAGRCCPTRAALLTGLYSHQAGIGDMAGDDGLPGYRGRLTDHCATIAEALQPAGYDSYGVGKWHVGADEPHWPIHAWPEDIARYKDTYRIGWDKLREQRYKRLVDIGVIRDECDLSARDEEVPAWDSLTDEQQKEMAHKMAVYAAMVDRMDQNIGRLLDTLRRTGAMDDTLILFLSDNGGSHEGGVWGFDRCGNGVAAGGPDSYMSYGRGWANASNTPFRMFKHWVHEGGISTPLIARWPGVVRSPGGFTDTVGHVIDLMATCCDAAGIQYPKMHNGHPIVPLEGKSLVPIIAGGSESRHEMMFWEHEGNRAVREGHWKLVSKYPQGTWELYDLSRDRCELHDLAGEQPDRVTRLKAAYAAWAERCGVVPKRQLDQHRKEKRQAARRG
ncbi:MAG: arylsulfatase [Candidatus Methanofastidiosa archaeon]|nr:arylsulfatase [Candidatus Methanofastidiosa archaeon]